MSGILLPGAATGSGLTYVSKDKEWKREIIVGRSTCEFDEWQSPQHRKAAIMASWLQMVADQDKRASIWTGDTPKVAGPLPHLDFSEDSNPDMGPLGGAPDPRDIDAVARYETAEKAKASRRAGLATYLVDFTLTAPFKRRVTGAFTARFS